MRTLLPALLLLAAACGTGTNTRATDSVLAARDTLTRHQKDSIIAQSAVPGANVVGRAMAVQDSGAAHQAAVDSAAREP
jgi:hypothetical protein